MRLHVLLAAELVVAGGVFHADHKRACAVALAQGLGDVKRERQVAAGVLPDLDAVEPGGHPVVAGFEVEQGATAGRRRGLNLPRIPEGLVVVEQPLHARELRFNSEGHEDLAIPGAWGRTAEHRRDRVVPAAIEVGPAVTNQLRPRILSPGVLRRDLAAPSGDQLRHKRLLRPLGSRQRWHGGRVDKMHVDRLPAAGLCAVDSDQIAAGREQLCGARVEAVHAILGDEAREAGGLGAVDEHIGILIVVDQQGGLRRHGVELHRPPQPDLWRVPGGADPGARC